MTINEAYIKYLDYINIKLKPQSVKTTISKFNNYILPYIGNNEISNFSEIDYLKWQLRIDKLNFSYRYKKALHYSNVALFNYLAKFYDMNKNIPARVGNFKNNFDKSSELVIWSIDEYIKFSQMIEKKDYIYKVLFDLLYFTGLRIGEALALTYNDLLLERNEIYVNKTITKEFFNGKKLITLPKTATSIRYIPIDEMLKNELIKLKQLNGNDDNNKLIFDLSITTINRKKDYYCKLASVKKIRLHDFRHSYATLLVNNKIPINIVSHVLGHSNINTTIKTYVHFDFEDEKRVCETLNSIRLNN